MYLKQVYLIIIWERRWKKVFSSGWPLGGLFDNSPLTYAHKYSTNKEQILPL